MCFFIHETHTICGHRTSLEWLCKAGYTKKFKHQYSFKPAQKKQLGICPRAKKDKKKIEFGFCPRCVEHREALEKARA
ncbi:hypothetical protein QBC32DRAFT_209108 [Pseudoneurospora amorphoporcata]|uniref:Uncharacterized protein n=1 Tax=Pseudoneurospora amorphoporcata TaxID=241081 RepID=A0AAN6SGW1_9PEZI|nr:hypothetical protein QBC32DRAFT_209108 [Pseudoneurospora amorphoporcata]